MLLLLYCLNEWSSVFNFKSNFLIAESPPQKPPRELPPNVTDADKDLFKQAQDKAQEVLKQVGNLVLLVVHKQKKH